MVIQSGFVKVRLSAPTVNAIFCVKRINVIVILHDKNLTLTGIVISFEQWTVL